MTQHFSALSEAEQERLAILIEECGEVVQAACKILRHGYESTDPTVITPEDKYPETNRWALENELGDLAHAIHRMEAAEDIQAGPIAERAASKAERILPYLHHQDRP